VILCDTEDASGKRAGHRLTAETGEWGEKKKLVEIKVDTAARS
jgi:hypothetical protein